MKTQLVYKVAQPEDWPAITEFVKKTNYFMPVDVETLDGTWAVATDGKEIKAMLWFFHEGPNAYVDYWAGGKISSITLLVFVTKLFKDNGIKYVRGSVHSKNEAAARVLVHGMGGVIGTDNNSFFKVID